MTATKAARIGRRRIRFPSARGCGSGSWTCRTRAPVPGSVPLPGAVVAEGVVSVADDLAETELLGALDEVEALLGVAGDPVEEGAEGATRGETHVLGRLVAEQLEHDELRGRHVGHARRERE